MFTLILIGLFTILFTIFCKHRYSYWKKRGIKTPKIIYVLGTMLDETKDEPRKTEERYLRDLGPVFGTFYGFKPVLNTSKIEHIKEVLGDLKRFPNESTLEFNDKYLQKGMLFRSDHKWKEQRQIQTHYFTSKKLKSLFDHFDKCAKNLLTNIESMKNESQTGDIDAKEISRCYACDVISKVLFAIDIDSYKEKNHKLVKNVLKLGELNKLSAFIMTIAPRKMSKFFGLCALNTKPMEELGDYFKNLIKQRRKDGIKWNDLSEMLQEASDENKLTEEEVIGNIILAFFGGLEPASNATSMMLYFLAHNLDVQEKLRKEIFREFSEEIEYESLTQNTYLDAFVQESLRLGNNVLMLTRTCAEDTKLGDLSLERGTEIKIITALPHVDSDYFENPLHFNPDRWLKNGNEKVKDGHLFIPFGYGHKMCIGMRLALLEAKYLVVRILQNYKISQPTDKKEYNEHFRGFISRRKLNIKIDRLA